MHDYPAFLEALRRWRLLEPGQLDEVARQPPAEPRGAARELVQRGWLTPHQVNRLFQGKGDELLLGSYVLLEKLGEGGMGQVFKARNWKLGRVVALKLIRKDRLASDVAVQRFQREIRAAAQLDHPNIVRALDADYAGDTHFFVMEFVAGTDLAKLLKQRGPLPVGEACEYARQTALGLQHAYERGLVHRDIKPHNLLLTGSPSVVKILDFGLARIDHQAMDESSSELSTADGTVMGTLDYLAPEQARDAHRADIRADLYSLGCTLYHLLTGKVPFPGGSVGEKIARHLGDEPRPIEALRPDVPPAVAAVVSRLMAKQKEQRYATPAEAARALADAGAFPTASPVAANLQQADDATFAFSAPAHPVRPGRPRQRIWRAGLIVAAIVIALSVLALRWLLPGGTRSDPDDIAAFDKDARPDDIQPKPKTKPVDPVPHFGPWQSLLTDVGTPPPSWMVTWDPTKSSRFAAYRIPDEKEPLLAASGDDALLSLFRSDGQYRIEGNYHLRLDFVMAPAELGKGLTIIYHQHGDCQCWVSHRSSGASQVYALVKSGCFANEAELRAGRVVAKGERFELAKAPPCSTRALKPPGEWNTLELICVQDTAIHLLNGQVLQVLAKLQRNTADGELPLTSGIIGLKVDGQVIIRRMGLRSINAIPPTVPDWTAWQPLFNGKDLTGWREGGKQQGFGVEPHEGMTVLTAKGVQGSWLSPQGKFENYHVRLDFKPASPDKFSFEVTPIAGSGVPLILNHHGQRYTLKSGTTRFHVGELKGAAIVPRENAPLRYFMPSVALKAADQWNTLEIVRLGDACAFRLNDQTLGAIANVRLDIEGKESIPAASVFSIAAQVSPVFIRRVEMRPITALPAEFVK